MTPAAAPPCCLLQSLGDPRLGGALPGFTVAPQGLALDDAAFACCGATGRRLLPDAGVTTTCDLNARLGTLRRLLRAFDKQAASDGRTAAGDLSGTPPAALDAALRQLAALKDGRAQRGLLLRREVEAPRCPSLWVVAFTAAWRFGFEPHVVTLGKVGVEELVPRGDALPPNRPVVVLVEGAQRLWDAQVADQLELVVAWAYNAGAPLFLELALAEGGAPRGATDGARNVKLALSRRLDKVKSRSPLAWLRDDCVSKLGSLCEGVRELERAATPRRTPPRPQAVKLPWDP